MAICELKVMKNVMLVFLEQKIMIIAVTKTVDSGKVKVLFAG